jgi:ATP-dependent RNA helicase RhlE
MKHAADRLARQLEQHGINCATLHSNRSQAQRLRALRDFKSGAVRVLVATDIAARGIDVDGISHVVNFDFPMHAEDYVHRIGRTGRAQAIGDAISFVTPEDQKELRALERFIGRGLVRKQAEDFDYTDRQPQPAAHPQPRPQQQQRQPQRPPQPQGGRGQGQPRQARGNQPGREANRPLPPQQRADSWHSGFAPEPGTRSSSSGRPGGRSFRRRWSR